jgi:hypothetical protein
MTCVQVCRVNLFSRKISRCEISADLAGRIDTVQIVYVAAVTGSCRTHSDL